MICIYEVRYAMQWQSAEPDHWENQSVRVAAGRDAVEAIDKARKAALACNRLDENGHEQRCIGFRLREISLIAEAQL